MTYIIISYHCNFRLAIQITIIFLTNVDYHVSGNLLSLKEITSQKHGNKVSPSLLFSFLQLQQQPPEVFYKKCVLKNFAKFTGKHLCQNLFINKVAGL